MATNPRVPADDHARVHDEASRKSGFPWPLLAIIVAALILVALIWWLPRTPKASPAPTGAAVPAQPTPGQIQLTNIKLATSPAGGQVYLDALLHNTGNTIINGVLVNVTFPGANGAAAGSVQVPVSALTSGDNPVQEPLVDHPIQPNHSQLVRIAVPSAPAGWNRQLPAVSIVTVTAVSAAGGNATPPANPAVTVKGKASGGVRQGATPQPQQ